jgi:excisionase family DNA binding protein
MLTLPEKAHFRPSELPRYLPISRATVYRMIEEGKIYPVSKVNNQIFIPRNSLVSIFRSQPE